MRNLLPSNCFAVVLLLLMLFPSCKKNVDDTLVEAAISTDQSAFTIGNDDIEAGFTVTADEPAASDMLIAITATGSTEGMYVLNNKNLTINAGERAASGSVIFLASQFTVTRPALSLRISARSVSADMAADASFVDYEVTFDPITAEISAPVRSVTVSGTDVTVFFNVKLSRIASENLTFEIVDTGAGVDAQGSYHIPDRENGVTVVKGSKEATGSVVFDSEWFGSHPHAEVNLSLQINTDSPKVVIPANPADPEENMSVEITAKGA